MNSPPETKLDVDQLRVLAAVDRGWVDYLPEYTIGWGSRQRTIIETYEINSSAGVLRKDGQTFMRGEQKTVRGRALRRLGFIEIGDSDGRRKPVTVTEKGRQYLAKDPRSTTVLDAESASSRHRG